MEPEPFDTFKGVIVLIIASTIVISALMVSFKIMVLLARWLFY